MTFQKETFLQTYRNTNLSALHAFLLAYPDALSVADIQVLTGHGRNQIGRAVAFLEQAGIVVRSGRYGSRLTPGKLQEFLSMFPVDNFQDVASDLFAKAEGRTAEVHPTHRRGASRHDHDHDDDHTYENDRDWLSVDKEALEQRLNSMNFGGAASFIRGNKVSLIQAWIEYYDGLPAKAKQRLHSAGGFVRGKVKRGEYPPKQSALVNKIPEEYKDIIKR